MANFRSMFEMAFQPGCRLRKGGHPNLLINTVCDTFLHMELLHTFEVLRFSVSNTNARQESK